MTHNTAPVGVTSEQHLRKILLRPEYAEALVAWDRDIAPAAELHDIHWGDAMPCCARNGHPGHTGPWVSLAVDGQLACCHFRYDAERAMFVRCETWRRQGSVTWCPLDGMPLSYHHTSESGATVRACDEGWQGSQVVDSSER